METKQPDRTAESSESGQQRNREVTSSNTEGQSRATDTHGRSRMGTSSANQHDQSLDKSEPGGTKGLAISRVGSTSGIRCEDEATGDIGALIGKVTWELIKATPKGVKVGERVGAPGGVLVQEGFARLGASIEKGIRCLPENIANSTPSDYRDSRYGRYGETKRY